MKRSVALRAVARARLDVAKMKDAVGEEEKSTEKLAQPSRTYGVESASPRLPWELK